MGTRKFLKAIATNQLPALLWAGLIYAVSSISQLPEPDLGITFLDKLAHMVEFAIFFLLIFRALGQPPILMRGRALAIVSVLLPVAFALIDEYHQRFVPGRQADPADLVADVVGVIPGGIAIFIFYRRKATKAFINSQ